MFIYKITNRINGKIYIGKTTKSIEERFAAHIRCANNGYDQPLYRSIRKYRDDNSLR